MTMSELADRICTDLRSMAVREEAEIDCLMTHIAQITADVKQLTATVAELRQAAAGREE